MSMDWMLMNGYPRCSHSDVTRRARYLPNVDLDQKGNLCAPRGLEHTSLSFPSVDEGRELL